jgi:peptidoglycan/LPS O-acetylase OafA/YrhL
VSSHPISYRPDIDGLRALAVVPVVLFHAFPNLLPGGFVGVDIFFVISGYLITSILLKDMQAGQYSLAGFYARRVRRIFPALSVVLLFCLILGWVVLTAIEYRQLAKHVMGGSGFVANIMLWKELGYFDTAADTKPLLHLWSLGIEEQFYIVWPLLLYFIFKRSWPVGRVLIGLGLLSFLLNVARVGTDPSATFYSPLSRSWELALGALLAYLAMKPQRWWSLLVEQYATVLSVGGFILLMLGFVLIDPSKAFPGWWALLPALGTVAMMAAGSQAWLNRYVLSNRLLVGIGLISFPLYLWHWPLLSFARIIYSETPPLEARLILVAMSVGFAWLTYQFLEKPIRRSLAKRSVIIILISVMLGITLAGLAVYKTKGAGFRHAGALNADPASLVMGADRGLLLKECGIPDDAKKILSSCYSPRDQKASYAIWGDSKGEAIFYGLAREAASHQGLSSGAWMMVGNVAPIIGDIPRVASIAQLNQYAINSFTTNPDLKVVMVAPAARALFSLRDAYTREELEASPLFEESLLGVSNAVTVLEKAGKKVVFLVDHPGFPDPRSCISGGLTKSDFLNQFLYRKENPHCSMTYDQYLHTNERYYAWIEQLQKRHPQLIVYNPSHVVCDVPGNRCGIAKNGQFLYAYGDHYSDYGNSLVAKDFLEKLPRLLAK